LKDFIEYAFDYPDLDWKKYVKQDESLLKRKNSGVYCGNYSKLTEWKPKTDIKSLAHLMVDEELKSLNNLV